MDSFFGGSGGSQTTTTTRKPNQLAEFQDLTAQAQEFNRQGTPDVSGSTELFQQAGNAAQGFAAGLPGQVAPAQQASNFALTNAINPGTNPALQQYIQLANDQLGRQFQQTIAPQLKGNAVAAGNVGSSRAGIAEGIAAQGLIDAQQRQTTGITQGAYGQGLQAMIQALGLAPQTAGLGGLETNALTAAADLTRQGETNQYGTDATGLQLYRDLISGDFGGTTTQVGPPPQEASLFQNLLGTAATGASIFAALNPATAPLALGLAGANAVATPRTTAV